MAVRGPARVGPARGGLRVAEGGGRSPSETPASRQGSDHRWIRALLGLGPVPRCRLACRIPVRLDRARHRNQGALGCRTHRHRDPRIAIGSAGVSPERRAEGQGAAEFLGAVGCASRRCDRGSHPPRPALGLRHHCRRNRVLMAAGDRCHPPVGVVPAVGAPSQPGVGEPVATRTLLDRGRHASAERGRSTPPLSALPTRWAPRPRAARPEPLPYRGEPES